MRTWGVQDRAARDALLPAGGERVLVGRRRAYFHVTARLPAAVGIHGVEALRPRRITAAALRRAHPNHSALRADKQRVLCKSGVVKFNQTRARERDSRDNTHLLLEELHCFDLTVRRGRAVSERVDDFDEARLVRPTKDRVLADDAVGGAGHVQNVHGFVDLRADNVDGDVSESLEIEPNEGRRPVLILVARLNGLVHELVLLGFQQRARVTRSRRVRRARVVRRMTLRVSVS